MGVIYVVVPLDTEVAARLDGEAILHPPASDCATMPSPREILDVLDMLGGLRIDVSRDEANARIDIDIAEVGGKRSTTLRLSESGLPDTLLPAGRACRQPGVRLAVV